MTELYVECETMACVRTATIRQIAIRRLCKHLSCIGTGGNTGIFEMYLGSTWTRWKNREKDRDRYFARERTYKEQAR